MTIIDIILHALFNQCVIMWTTNTIWQWQQTNSNSIESWLYIANSAHYIAMNPKLKRKKYDEDKYAKQKQKIKRVHMNLWCVYWANCARTNKKRQIRLFEGVHCFGRERTMRKPISAFFAHFFLEIFFGNKIHRNCIALKTIIVFFSSLRPNGQLTVRYVSSTYDVAKKKKSRSRVEEKQSEKKNNYHVND